MAEYIDREALIRYVEKQEVIIKDELSIADAMRIQGNVFRRAVETCPAADVVEVRHGEWLDGCLSEKCSICGHCVCWDDGYLHNYNYCPNCGAKMTERSKTDD